jgi:hypothetical protein
LSGSSGIVAYEIGSNSMKIRFINGEVYLYDEQNTGRANIEEMKKLAKVGRGLSTFIAKHVHDKYAAKLS